MRLYEPQLRSNSLEQGTDCEILLNFAEAKRAFKDINYVT